MYRVTCNGCGASVITPDGNSDALACPCCPEPHSHEESANSCPGMGLNHVGVECAHPAGGAECLAVTGPGEDCPGEHCHMMLDGCTVCRSCTLEWLGVMPVTPAVIRA